MAAPLSVILDARRTDLDAEAVAVGRVIAAFAAASAAGLVRDMAILRPSGAPAGAYEPLAEAIGARLVAGRPSDAAGALSAEWTLLWRATAPLPIDWEARLTGRIERRARRDALAPLGRAARLLAAPFALTSSALTSLAPPARHGALRRREALARLARSDRRRAAPAAAVWARGPAE